MKFLTGLVFLLLNTVAAVGQSPDYFLKTSDGELAMELSRGSQSINIALFFFKASELEQVIIERSLDSQKNFNQCSYVSFNESAKDSTVIVKKDIYPISVAGSVFYRVKVVNREGITRTYPSVRLPGIAEAKD